MNIIANKYREDDILGSAEESTRDEQVFKTKYSLLFLGKVR